MPALSSRASAASRGIRTLDRYCPPRLCSIPRLRVPPPRPWRPGLRSEGHTVLRPPLRDPLVVLHRLIGVLRPLPLPLRRRRRICAHRRRDFRDPGEAITNAARDERRAVRLATRPHAEPVVRRRDRLVQPRREQRPLEQRVQLPIVGGAEGSSSLLYRAE